MHIIKFSYLYRDASNYKKWGEVYFTNPENLTIDEIDSRLCKSFESEQFFIARQIDIPEVFLYPEYPVNEDDHSYHEYDCVEFEEYTGDSTKLDSINNFMEKVERVSKVGWKAYNIIS